MNYLKPPFSLRLTIILFFSFLSLLSASGQGVEGRPEFPPQDKNTRSPERIVNITALQAGSNHYKNGNPGLEANFAVFATLARKAAASKPRPDLICLPEYSISGWSYPPEKVINGLAEPIPGNGYWYNRYVSLAREIGIPLLGWLVESEGGKLYNTIFMLNGKGEYIGKYRKVQANLGEQTWWGWSQGEQFKLIELDGVKYAFSICADMDFPETVRCAELMGADVLLHGSIADDQGHLIPARAYDSKLPIVATIFQGGSYAADAEGKILGKLSPIDSAWITFQIHPFANNFGNKYGGVWDIKKGMQNLRNVKAYSILTDPSTRPPWTVIFMDNKANPQTKEQLLTRFKGRYDANEGTRLGTEGTRFTVNGYPEFLYGMSYYGALGASEEFILKDLSDLKKYGFNWIRVWANWTGFKKVVSCIDGDGNPKEPFYSRMKWLVDECNKKGIIVDVTLTRGKDERGPVLQTLAAHMKAVTAITELLKPYNNWYLDLGNERDVRDQRFVGFEDLKILCETAKKIKPTLLVTASAGNDISSEELLNYLQKVKVDFICPHRPRNAGSILQTRVKTIEYLAWMKEAGRIVPVNYQEPFRRGYSDWQPVAMDFASDMINAKAGGAASWCFHNGGQKGEVDEKPRRSFDMSEKRLFDQLDKEELEAIEIINNIFQK